MKLTAEKRAERTRHLSLEIAWYTSELWENYTKGKPLMPNMDYPAYIEKCRIIRKLLFLERENEICRRDMVAFDMADYV